MDEYLIWSNEHEAWWRANRRGYTNHVRGAGRYSREEAVSICSGARDGFYAVGIPPEIPVPFKDVLECLVLKPGSHDCDAHAKGFPLGASCQFPDCACW